MKRFKPLFLLMFVAILAALFACASDSDFGKSCPLPEDFIDKNCKDNSGTGTNDALTCVNENHPTCSTQLCLIYQESAPFCSRSCASDDDCPGKARCIETIFKNSDGSNKKYCVPENPPQNET